eukprot:gene29220-35272_t
MVKFAFWKSSKDDGGKDPSDQPTSRTAKDKHSPDAESGERGRKASKSTGKSRSRSASPGRSKSGEKSFLSSLFGLKSHTPTPMDEQTQENTQKNAKRAHKVRASSSIQTSDSNDTSRDSRQHVSFNHVEDGHAKGYGQGYGQGYEDGMRAQAVRALEGDDVTGDLSSREEQKDGSFHSHQDQGSRQSSHPPPQYAHKPLPRVNSQESLQAHAHHHRPLVRVSSLESMQGLRRVSSQESMHRYGQQQDAGLRRVSSQESMQNMGSRPPPVTRGSSQDSMQEHHATRPSLQRTPSQENLSVYPPPPPAYPYAYAPDSSLYRSSYDSLLSTASSSSHDVFSPPITPPHAPYTHAFPHTTYAPPPPPPPAGYPTYPYAAYGGPYPHRPSRHVVGRNIYPSAPEVRAAAPMAMAHFALPRYHSDSRMLPPHYPPPYPAAHADRVRPGVRDLSVEGGGGGAQTRSRRRQAL